MFRRLAREERGATAVEFALIALPLFLFLFGIIEYGRLEWTRNALESTANVAARCMGIPQTECSTAGAYNAERTRAFVAEHAGALSLRIDPDNVTLDRDATCNGVAGFSQVTITHTFETAVPLLFGQMRGGVPLTAEVCFPNQPSA